MYNENGRQLHFSSDNVSSTFHSAFVVANGGSFGSDAKSEKRSFLKECFFYLAKENIFGPAIDEAAT